MLETMATYLWRPFAALGILTFATSIALAAPAAPSALSGSSISPSQVQLSWKDNSSAELGFVVQRSLSSGSGFTQIARVGSNIVNYSDSGLTSGTTYFYRVAAYGYNRKRSGYVYSAFSNIASVQTPSATAAPAPTPAATPTAQISKTQFAPGEDIAVSVSGTGQNADEWLALYVASNPDSAWSYNNNWVYLNGTQTVPTSPISSNILHFKAPMEAGTYNFRLFAKTGYETRLSVSPNFSVVAPATSPTADGFSTYQRVYDGANRTYNFDGATPFVNPTIGKSDLMSGLYNAIEFYNWDITNDGRAPWIQKVDDNGAQVTRFQVFPTDKQLYNWRTQLDGYWFELYKTYRYDLEFKLDPSWDFNMGSLGDGLLWQTKGSPKAGQYGHAVMGLNITGHTLYFGLLYPTTAMNATTWPTSITWGPSDYVKTNFPTQQITSGQYYKIRIEMFADDRPPQFGGQGYVKIYLNGQLWIDYTGPNIHPDQNPTGHRWDFGWYNWGGQPTSTRTIYFKTSHAYSK